MKEYFKMANHFSGVVVVDHDGNLSDERFHRGSLGDFDENYFGVIAHAINSHDELVAINKELLEALKRVVFDLNELSNNSDGVSGLHQNGDIAKWSSLRSGGFNEGWLLRVDEAECVIEKMEGCAA